MPDSTYDAAIVGSGPNGLAAGIKLAQEGLSVVVYEAKATIGGGLRTAELTLPGYKHDICSAIHPLAVSSPFFNTLPLDQHGLEWVYPDIQLAHPFDTGKAALLYRSIERSADTLNLDAYAYKNLFESFVKNWDFLKEDLLAPLQFPKHPWLMARFGFYGIRSANSFLRSSFDFEKARGLFAGLAAHSNMSLKKSITSAFGLVLGISGHAVGWPFPKGGSQKIADALASYFQSLGGKIYTNTPIENLAQIRAKVILCDITPKQLIQIAGNQLPSTYKKRLERYRYGPGVFKMDWALSSPIPWIAEECLKAGTVHIGGTAEEIVYSEEMVAQGKVSTKPYIILAQQSLFDKTRAPEGKQTAWGYCHVPNGFNENMTGVIENQIERFAPGFKDCILARSTKSPIDLEKYNPNLIGGDINGGIQDIYQLFTRPIASLSPYATPLKNVYICSSSTPPGGGVHGMCGYQAALSALRKSF